MSARGAGSASATLGGFGGTLGGSTVGAFGLSIGTIRIVSTGCVASTLPHPFMLFPFAT